MAQPVPFSCTRVCHPRPLCESIQGSLQGSCPEAPQGCGAGGRLRPTLHSLKAARCLSTPDAVPCMLSTFLWPYLLADGCSFNHSSLLSTAPRWDSDCRPWPAAASCVMLRCPIGASNRCDHCTSMFRNLVTPFVPATAPRSAAAAALADRFCYGSAICRIRHLRSPGQLAGCHSL